MSRRLPALTGHDVLRALIRGGFYVHHVKGSHHSLRHPERPEPRVVVPVHRKDLPPGTIRSIIKQSGLTEEEFLELL
jgi:predicted RNA binding protein YcfA (HicA-like mRNA interferase family)